MSNIVQNATPGLPEQFPRQDIRHPKSDASFWQRNGAFKRIVDIVLSFSAIIALFPIMLLIVLGVKLSSRGPVIYKQDRVGRNGDIFPMYKFRTMYIDSDNVLDALLRSCPRSAEEWSIYQKLRFDPRITPIGHFLRKTSLDELPQLFNVMFGHMSMVGQRPILSTQIESYGTEHFTQYIRSRPGITGLWQVSGRNGLSFEKRAALGTEYSHSWSNRYDFILLLKTVPALIKSSNAY